MTGGVGRHGSGWLAGIVSALFLMAWTSTAGAQPAEHGMGGMGQCPMMAMGGGMGIVAMVLGFLLTLAVIAALVALTVFLIRRSHPRVG